MQPAGLARADAVSIALTQRIAFAGVMGMLIIGILTTIDVVILRALFNAPIPGSNEFLNTIFAVAIAAVLASGLAQRATLEIDILQKRLGDRATGWLRAIGNGLFLAALVLIAWRVAVHSWDAYLRNLSTVILQWKTWPFLWTITALFFICVPVQFIVFCSSVATALKGGFAGRAGPEAAGSVWNMTFVILAAIVVAAAVIYFGIGWSQATLSRHGIGLAIFFFFLLWALILLFVPLAAALALSGLLGTAALMGFSQAFSVLGSETVGLITNADLAVIPLFLIMGGFATAGGLSSDIYRLAHALFGFQRGGLALATIGGCAGFGALTGSSLATVATIGSVALPEMKARGYSPELSTGCIAAGGTLGQLVPPSTAIVIYALLVEQSIGRLYIAVLIPALMTALFYMLAVGVTVWLKPESAPGRDKFDMAELLAALKGCIGVFLMFGAVIGGIYTGIFTATEAAAVGAVIAFVIAWWRGKLGRGALWSVVSETTRSTAMLYFVIIGAMAISFFMGTSGLPAWLTEGLTGSGLPRLAIIILLVIVYIILGCVMDSFTIMIITAPLVASVIVILGYDPIWWGIMMVVLVEMGVVTPPFGLNLFVMKSMVPDVPLTAIFRGVMPFVIADTIKVILLIAFPALVLWLPSVAFNR
ncbi:MAG: TRAP transporter large permease subunit [Betaproteobacteria bacterium]|nr:TRAP transporter large permease subunit [Betaproteobacteria bacterium]